MKLIKKITAAVTAMALAASTMSIGASAYQFSDSWQDLKYAPGLGSMIHTQDYAYVQARTDGATLMVNTTIYKTGNPYMTATAINASNDLTIYYTGSYGIQFTSDHLEEGEWKRVDVTIAGFNPYSSITAIGYVSN